MSPAHIELNRLLTLFPAGVVRDELLAHIAKLTPKQAGMYLSRAQKRLRRKAHPKPSICVWGAVAPLLRYKPCQN